MYNMTKNDDQKDSEGDDWDDDPNLADDEPESKWARHLPRKVLPETLLL